LGQSARLKEYIFRDVLPAFGDRNERAKKVGAEHNEKPSSEAAPENWDGDMVAIAGDAHERALDWYQMMISLRQSMLNLLAAGLFHLTEQRLALVCILRS
jgi:hypothetical protein